MGICYWNALNGLVEKNVVGFVAFMKGRIVFDITTQPLVTNKMSNWAVSRWGRHFGKDSNDNRSK